MTDVYGSLARASALVRLRALIAVCAQCLMSALRLLTRRLPPRTLVSPLFLAIYAYHVARVPPIAPVCPHTHHQSSPASLPMMCPTAVPTLQAGHRPRLALGAEAAPVQRHEGGTKMLPDDSVQVCFSAPFRSTNRRPATTPNPSATELK